MRILLTNDDGYNQEGILLLRKELEKYGEVFLVAPKVVQSAKGCAITIDSFHYQKFDEHTYAIEGTPIDCVIFGLCVIKDIDLIVSGCNNSPNMGVDTIYSGTLGACTQALIANYCAIAFSCAGKDYFNQIPKFTSMALEYIFDNKLLSKNYFLNVNFPSGEFEEAKGIKLTKLYYQRVNYQTSILEENLFRSKRTMNNDIVDSTYDMGAFNTGYISITPLSVNNFDEGILAKLLKED